MELRSSNFKTQSVSRSRQENHRRFALYGLALLFIKSMNRQPTGKVSQEAQEQHSHTPICAVPVSTYRTKHVFRYQAHAPWTQQGRS